MFTISSNNYITINPDDIHDHYTNDSCQICDKLVEYEPEVKKYAYTRDIIQFDLILKKRKKRQQTQKYIHNEMFSDLISSIKVIKKIKSGYNFYGTAFEFITDIKIKGKATNVRIENVCGGTIKLFPEEANLTLLLIKFMPRLIIDKVYNYSTNVFIFPQFTNENPLVNKPMIYDRLRIVFDGEAEVEYINHMSNNDIFLKIVRKDVLKTNIINYKAGFIYI